MFRMEERQEKEEKDNENLSLLRQQASASSMFSYPKDRWEFR